MQTRFLMVALAVCGLLVLTGAGMMLTPRQPPTRRLPQAAVMDDAPLSHAPLTTDKQPEAAAEPVIQKLAAPPPAPEVKNDPATGRIWLRLIDADSNRPLADTLVELLPAGVNAGQCGESYSYLLTEPHPEPRRTDTNGLLSLSASGESDQGEAEVVLDDLHGEAIFEHVPVPRGWYPLADTETFGRALNQLGKVPASRPLDVLLRRLVDLTVRVHDRFGVSVTGTTLRVNAVSDDFDGGFEWLETFCQPIQTWAGSAWRDGTQNLREDFSQDRVACNMNGVLLARRGFSHDPWDGETSYDTGAFATRSFHNLPCVNIGVVGTNPRYGMASATCQLGPGGNVLDVFFGEAPAGELRVRIHCQPPHENGPAGTLQLLRSGPNGFNDFIGDSRDSCDQDWTLPDGDGNAEVVLTGLKAGWWHVNLSNAAGANVKLAAGETRIVDLYIGANAKAHWTPVVKIGGTVAEHATFWLLGGAEELKTETSVDAGDALALSPGTWMVWMPTLPVFTFTLKPGEKRSDVFELQLANVSFSITRELAQLLGADDVRLDLLPDGIWAGISDHLVGLDANMRSAIADYDTLRPGVTRNWTLPIGEYKWRLIAPENELEGRVRITRDGQINFDIGSLPGRPALVVDLLGFEPDAAIDFDIRDADEFCVTPAAMVYGQGPAIVMPGPFSDMFDVDVDVYRVSPGRAVIFAQPGGMVLRIYDGDNARNFVVDFPGHISVTPADLNPPQTSLSLTTSAQESGNTARVSYAYELWGGDDWFVSESYIGTPRQLDVPQGALSLVVFRTIYDEPDTCRTFSARFALTAGANPLTVDLSKGDYQPLPTATLKFQGRGSPEQTTDAWWTSWMAPPRLIALDGPHPRLVDIENVSDYLSDDRLEFTIGPLQLPPGRYRLIPWPDAPRKYWQEFTLKSGRHTSVVVKGG